MEESIMRQERLKAMRMEASEGGVGDGSINSSIVSQSLANPLIQANSPSSIGSEQHFSPRFDYYTDPMAAFSANKRSSKVSHQISPDFTTHPSTVNQSSILPTADLPNSTPDLRPFQAQGPYYSPGPFRAPDPIGSSHPYSSPGPGPGPFRSPVPMGSPNPYNMPRGNISHWGRPGDSSPNFFPNASPGYGQGNRPSFTYGQVNRPRGYRFDNNPQVGSGLRGIPYHNSGRGRSSGLGSSSNSSGSPGFTRSGSHNSVSAKVRPDMYYKKSMVEDPWKRLKPILWKQTSSSSNSWLPKSLGSKKPRVSVTPDKYKSGQSLAEYLAASFSEATNEADDNEDGHI